MFLVYRRMDFSLSMLWGFERESAVRKPSFAACIIDFKIPDLGIRDGKWKKGGRMLKGDL